MPLSYRVDKTNNHVNTKVTGPVTVGDILGHFEAARQEEILGYTELIDARGIGTSMSTADIWEAALSVKLSRVRLAFGRRAVVVDSDLNFGLVRLFATVVSGFFPIDVFRDQTEAENWLKLADGPPEAV